MTLAWINSQQEEVLTPPGTHRLVEFFYQIAPGAQVGSCSPLQLVDCLGDPLIQNGLVDRSDVLLPVSTEDSEVCVIVHSFKRGDVNVDDKFDISDPIKMLTCLFLSSEPRCLPCRDAADVDDSGGLNITDPIYMLNWLFGPGPQPPPPYPGCAQDTTGDGLECFGYEPCGSC